MRHKCGLLFDKHVEKATHDCVCIIEASIGSLAKEKGDIKLLVFFES